MNKVLTVDDDLFMTKMLDKILTAHAFEVSTANTGLGAIEFVRRQVPDAIVLDLMMPDLDGWEVCREIRTFSQVPILVLSAVVDSEGVMRALEEGANDYLVKPVPAGVLVSNLRRLIHNAQGNLEVIDAIQYE